jgi:hypothetical protein
MTWTNKDGLVVRFGAERASSADSGQVSGIKEYIVLDLPDATGLPTVSGGVLTVTGVYPAEDAPRIPASSVITNAWMVATTDFTSAGAATLDIGLIDAAGTIIDIDGIHADVALAALVDGSATGVQGCSGQYVANAGGPGQLVDADAWPVFTYTAAVYTAGAGKLIVEYIRVA